MLLKYKLTLFMIWLFLNHRGILLKGLIISVSINNLILIYNNWAYLN